MGCRPGIARTGNDIAYHFQRVGLPFDFNVPHTAILTWVTEFVYRLNSSVGGTSKGRQLRAWDLGKGYRGGRVRGRHGLEDGSSNKVSLLDNNCDLRGAETEYSKIVEWVAVWSGA